MGLLVKNQFQKTQTNLLTTMPVLVMLEGQVRADKMAEFKAFAQTSVANAKEQAGCGMVKAAVEKANRTVVIWQQWTDEAACKAYAEKVKSEGKMAKAVADFLEPGSFKRRELTPHQSQ